MKGRIINPQEVKERWLQRDENMWKKWISRHRTLIYWTITIIGIVILISISYLLYNYNVQNKDPITMASILLTIIIGLLTLYFVMKSSGFFKPNIMSIVPVSTYPEYMGDIPIYHLWAENQTNWNTPLIILKNLDIPYAICVEIIFLHLSLSNKSIYVKGEESQKLPFIIDKGGMKLYDISQHLIGLYGQFIKDNDKFEKMQISVKLRDGIVATFEGYLITLYLEIKIAERDEPQFFDEFKIFLAERSIHQEKST